MQLAAASRSNWGFQAAAGGLMQGLTAQYLSHVAVPVAEDAVVLVHSAGSGVGRMLTQLATHRGGRVIATVSRGHKARSALEAGAWQVLVRDE
jgi:NADPH2:quinone reductase